MEDSGAIFLVESGGSGGGALPLFPTPGGPAILSSVVRIRAFARQSELNSTLSKLLLKDRSRRSRFREPCRRTSKTSAFSANFDWDLTRRRQEKYRHSRRLRGGWFAGKIKGVLCKRLLLYLRNMLGPMPYPQPSCNGGCRSGEAGFRRGASMTGVRWQTKSRRERLVSAEARHRSRERSCWRFFATADGLLPLPSDDDPP